jgi:hypothetical protein
MLRTLNRISVATRFIKLKTFPNGFQKQFLCLLVLLSVSAACPIAFAQFNLPQEVKGCPADTSSIYDGVTYQNIPLGISFSKFKTLVNAGHHALVPKREIEEAGVQFVYKAADEWQVGSFKWTPAFCFVEDNGVYRLSTIRGTIKDFPAFKTVIATLDQKYRKHSVEKNHFVWKVGRHNNTAVILEDSLPGWLYFHDVNLLELGMAKRQANTPGL